ncbi:MAG TPA: J domain-containing protein [Ramlibacter sp.]|jgi:curved DNA-binding protein CbpA|uniref:J domain-containing protein n=1 Tax=Ramlibacter sp. TaxID=1917967 RepID=UPI002D5628A7|nr:J domain-containing protein [Ramlibacter sp.]HZY18088.1 J domain-containing protein [Ramlibacter sp.]
MSLYDILQLGRDASGEEVRRAYHRLARAHHPDQGGSSEQMALVNQAYEILSDSHRRTQYDLSLRPATAPRRIRRGNPVLAVLRDPRSWMLLLAVCATAAAAGWAVVRKPWSERTGPAAAPSTLLPSGGLVDDPLHLVPSRRLDSWSQRPAGSAPQAPVQAGPARPPAPGEIASAR